jgi:uncharacterized protein (DUF427 family)
MTPERIAPNLGQESDWDYPRPPRCEPTSKHLKIIFNQEIIADTDRAYRVLETSHPPVYYIPPSDIKMEYLQLTSQGSFCEWKGQATYYNLQVGDKRANNVAWSYSQPTPRFVAIANYLAFYPQYMDSCYVNDELVQPQPGGFYGGWITTDIVGPFKGAAGTWGW